MEVESEQVESEMKLKLTTSRKVNLKVNLPVSLKVIQEANMLMNPQKFLRSRTKGEPFGMFVDHLL